MDADPAIRGEPRLPTPAELDLLRDVLEPRRYVDVLAEPCPHFECERLLFGREREIHAYPALRKRESDIGVRDYA